YENTITIRAPASKIPIIEGWLNAYAKGPEDVNTSEADYGDLRMVQLHNRTAYDMIDELEDAFSPPGGGGRQRSGPTFKSASSDDYMLIVHCKPREWPRIEEFVKKFDVPKGPVGRVTSTIIPAGQMDPAELARQIQMQTGHKVIIREGSSAS